VTGYAIPIQRAFENLFYKVTDNWEEVPQRSKMTCPYAQLPAEYRYRGSLPKTIFLCCRPAGVGC
jgi:hypothetical protein